MGDFEETSSTERLQTSFSASPSTIPKQLLSMNHQIPQLNTNQMRDRHFPEFANSNKRVGIPPSHPNHIPSILPYSQIPMSSRPLQQTNSRNFNPGSTHSRSLSQPSFFSFDSLPPLSPSRFRDSPSTSISTGLSMEDRDTSVHSMLLPSPYGEGSGSRVCEGLPLRKAHRRSNSDIPFGFDAAPPLLIPFKPAEGMGERKSEGDVDDLFSAYMDLDNSDPLNSYGSTDEKNGNENREDLDSRASGTKVNGGDSSDNEAESNVNESGSCIPRAAEKREGIKRSAEGNMAPTSRHYRSVSMDSFMEKLNFGDELPKLPLSPGPLPGQLSSSNSIDGNSTFSLEFGNGEFSGAELKKIMANDKLSEIAVTDPRRAKRILANRQSAARSKERKTRYISELEHKVQTLQTEATTLSAQLTLLQRDSFGLTNQNNEFKFRLQAMEQQAQLRDALNEALTTEVQRLKLEATGYSAMSRLSMKPQMFHSQHNVHQQQSTVNGQRSQHEQNGSATAKPKMDE